MNKSIIRKLRSTLIDLGFDYFTADSMAKRAFKDLCSQSNMWSKQQIRYARLGFQFEEIWNTQDTMNSVVYAKLSKIERWIGEIKPYEFLYRNAVLAGRNAYRKRHGKTLLEL